ncbi:Cell growth regulator with EF hand domain protein 1 [Triplophysa tibetana]|uniref:Cell growth regulator with EF hand domain protein 1 n=1 Tax=Triplophysa tibetana TaxID=1572043 RepID=A0A5A9NP68_9TELE|nr:Cell growth regulator with EF hand domain protein 1 [Triplophysa tibetana]
MKTGIGSTERSFIMERPLTATIRGVRSHVACSIIIARFLFLLILPSLSISAPQVQPISSDGVLTPELVNPFGPGEDNRRLLQSYIKSRLKEGQTSPELNTREQEFFLFSLYDYDRSGQMDGLELMQLLTDFLSYHAIMPKSTDSVVSLVDHILQTQDLNQDGLLAPSELLSYTLDHEQEENNILPPESQAEIVKETNREQTDTKTEGGDPKLHVQEAGVQEPEQDQLVEHENETQPAQQHRQVEEPRDLNQIPETAEHPDGPQL